MIYFTCTSRPKVERAWSRFGDRELKLAMDQLACTSGPWIHRVSPVLLVDCDNQCNFKADLFDVQ